MSFLDMNVMAAVMIVTIILVRKLLIYRIPHQIWNILWLLVVVRLYIPYKIETRFNFYNVLYYIRTVFAKNDFLEIGYQFYYFDRIMKEIINIPSVKYVLLFVWILGTIIMIRYFYDDFVLAQKLYKRSSNTPICKEAQQFLLDSGLNKRVEIKQSQEIDMPLAYSIFHPCILLPWNIGNYPESAIKQMLLHEYIHLKYKHSLLQIIMISTLCINWFNPIIWIWYHYMSRDMEIACDQHVLDLIGKNEREFYAFNLIQMAKAQSPEGTFYNGFAKYVIKERTVAIMKYKKTTMVALIISMLIPTSVVSAFGTSDNYVFDDEVKSGEVIVSVEETGAIAETAEIFIDYEEFKPYVVNQDERAVSSINIDGYEYVTYNKTPPATLKVSTKKDGYTYTGTLKLVDLKIDGSKYIGYYSGTLYRQ